MQITAFDDNLPQDNNFKSIILNQTPLIDVRAPIEFQQGAFETATNLPLMNDAERQQVGLCYKQQGHNQAVHLGHQLLTPTLRDERISSWQLFMEANPRALLYCFRGGMRSKIAQQWLKDRGYDITRLKGGYKAFRRYLIDQLEHVALQLNTNAHTNQSLSSTIISGRTGAGKTLVIAQLNNAIDLEGLAHHRGSAFGGYPTPQPTQINFENQLAMALIRQLEQGVHNLVFEDESAHIGSVNIPMPLHNAIKKGNYVELETPLEQRLQITLQEYVISAQPQYTTLSSWQQFMQAAINRIRKRLGGERHHRVATQFQQACDHQQKTGKTDQHLAWISTLLVEYYDPMYDYQKQKTPKTQCFKGNLAEVTQYLKALGTA
ncbi:tRNA 2-selenouridine(34) synthase MnmH [Hydrogenovibrio sp. SC-1]|uniref:tRNA 2-selenouridine(34) synthase MnmH n=1 Tax=Hydrogenovibrio sp. SC-1 TaxID=2065820 RepID=UPI000C79EC53|nr:tRNA 2-selenouridine(34) synthase MnmH [Hydrogenovibrio sp. SC-1]PLA75302.1 tRNA 2-selenouridine(34) synthase MnmH [Hydrogenovibrio sp. SC-1]